MAEFPALPLWTDAFLADTTHLGYAESGVYLAVLMHMWRCPGCRIPNDNEWLRRKFRLCEADFDNLLKPILNEFCQCDGNWWTQKRLHKEWEYLHNLHARQSENAKSMWRKKKDRSTSYAKNAEVAYAPTPTPLSKTPPSVTETQSPSETKPLTQTPPSGGNGHDKPKPEERGKRLAEDWQPSENAIAHCRNELGATAEILNREFAAFMDWGLSATGPPSRKRNWDRAFVNWIRRVMNGIREQENRERRWAERRAATR